MAIKLSRKPRTRNPLGGDERAVVSYLCGIVTDPAGNPVQGQESMACLYEHARESEILRRMAAEERKRNAESYDPGSWEEIEKRQEGIHSTYWLQALEFAWLWRRLGDYFPERPWCDIPLELRFTCRCAVRPLPVLSVSRFLSFGGAAQSAWDRWQNQEVPPGKPCSEFPVAVFPDETLREGVVAAFQVDFSKGKAALLAQFKAWLDQLDDDGALLKAGQKQSKDAKRWHDWLWDVAVWRLLHKICAGEVRSLQAWLETNISLFGRENEDKLLNREPSSWLREAGRMREHLELLLPFESARHQPGQDPPYGFHWEVWDELDTDQQFDLKMPDKRQGVYKQEEEFADYFRSVLEG
ncbi:MAG: hypothetical protein JO295_04095 [Verrucomicrobia bacterium]|nr:hypothetical protein [Verrucomicrobiota bacterium]